MKHVNNKGLTLVELLSVLIVLIIIFLIAVTKVNDVSDETENKAARASAISYVKAINDFFLLKNGDALFPVYEGLYTYDELHSIGVRVSGTEPTGGYAFNVNNKTRYACIEYKNRKVTIINDVATSVDTGKCKINFANGYNEDLQTFFANYSGSETTFTVPKDGKYLIEAWGAQGGSATDTYIGGYGGYSKGYINLNEGDILYINVGGAGVKVNKGASGNGGYNGGGNVTLCQWTSSTSTEYCATGGGATHIALSTGLLSTFSNNIRDILIVAAGGGGGQSNLYSGSSTCYVIGGSGGGNQSGMYTVEKNISDGITTYVPASQTGAATIRYSSNATYNGSFGNGSNSPQAGGGGGFYGGAGTHCGSTGGSGYIGNSLLTSKEMYCFNCEESENIDSKTITTDKYSETPASNTPKVGNGYARIIFVE